MKILIAEDEKKTASFVSKGLEAEGFVVDVTHDGQDAYDRIQTQPYDVVLLDVMLPGRDGLSILKNLRKQNNTTPILLLTARSEPHERVEGLNLGADDYLTKPFFLDELVARIHALGRRSDRTQLSLLQVDNLAMNLISHEVKRGETLLELTSREFNLLEVMMRSPGRVFNRSQLIQRVWGYDFDPQTNLVDVNIQRLRRKVDLDDETKLIETVRGVGYRMRKVD